MSEIEKLRKQLLEDTNIQNNIAAANQLGNASEKKEAIKVLIRGFEITDPNLHIALITALVKQEAKEAIPRISACLKSFNPTVRNSAIEALVNPSIREVKVVKIFKERIRFERVDDTKVLIIQRSASLPFKETVDFLLDLLKDPSFKVSPFVENINQSLSTVAPISPEKLIKELNSPIGDEIAKILTSIDLTTNPHVWTSFLNLMDVDETLYKKLHSVIVGQIQREYNEERVSKVVNNIVGYEATGRVKERSIRILDEISKTTHGPKLIKPTLQLLKERSEEEVKRAKFIEDLELEISHFDIAREYFEEAKSSLIKGNFKATIILAISALESCVKTDYVLNARQIDKKDEEQANKYVRQAHLNTLLDRYFDKKEIGRLPAEYKPIMDTYRKIRNSLVHPKEFAFSETVVKQTLALIAELIKRLEKQ